MDNSTLCPFCGKAIGKFSNKAEAALYLHSEIFENPDCDARIIFSPAPNIPERFSRRDGIDKDKCPFCNGKVELTSTAEGDALILCLDPKCGARMYFGTLAYLTPDLRVQYTAEEAAKKFKERSTPNG